MTPPQEDQIFKVSKNIVGLLGLVVLLTLVDPMIICAGLLYWIAFMKD